MPFDEFGREIPDPTPIEVPLKFQRPPTLQEQIRQMIRSESLRATLSEEAESFEEADDFDIDDEEDDILSPYEIEEWREMTPEEADADFDPPPADVAVPAASEQGAGGTVPPNSQPSQGASNE